MSRESFLATPLIFGSFVDRDMYMRYRGGGIGHIPTKVDEPEGSPPPVTAEEESDQGNGIITEPQGAGDGTEGREEEDEEDEDAENEEEGDDLGREEEALADMDEYIGIEEDSGHVVEEIFDDLGFAEL